MDREQARAAAPIANVRSNPLSAQANKVAAVTFGFWILKILTTTAGDLSGDVLSISLGLGYAIALIVTVSAAVILLIVQIRAKRFHAPLYWILMLSTSAAGAEISDSIDRGLHWGNPAGTGFLFLCVLVTLGVWHGRRGALGVYPINRRRDELFYWAAAIVANSLGSALGDLLGSTLGLGVLGGTLVFLAVLAVLLVLYRTTRLSTGLLFWSGFVVARIPF